MNQDDIPPIPAWPQVRIFLWGALWVLLGALAPTVTLIYAFLVGKEKAVDWPIVWHQAIVSGAVAVIGYARKHKALLTEPPTVQFPARPLEKS